MRGWQGNYVVIALAYPGVSAAVLRHLSKHCLPSFDDAECFLGVDHSVAWADWTRSGGYWLAVVMVVVWPVGVPASFGAALISGGG